VTERFEEFIVPFSTIQPSMTQQVCHNDSLYRQALPTGVNNWRSKRRVTFFSQMSNFIEETEVKIPEAEDTCTKVDAFYNISSICHTK